jgi:hypothetical protein
LSVQRLYRSTNNKTFIPVVSSTNTTSNPGSITPEGKALFQRFLQTDKHANVFTSKGIFDSSDESNRPTADPRAVNPFYLDVQWDTFFTFFGKTNTFADAKFFFKWINGLFSYSKSGSKQTLGHST